MRLEIDLVNAAMIATFIGRISFSSTFDGCVTVRRVLQLLTMYDSLHLRTRSRHGEAAE
jgi:hypothetical protein